MSDMYALWQELQGTDWQKHMDTSQGLFGQNLQSAQLGQNWAQLQTDAMAKAAAAMGSGSGGSNSVRATPLDIAKNYVNTTSITDPGMLSDYNHIIDLMAGPMTIKNKITNTPFGSLNPPVTGTHYGGALSDSDKDLYKDYMIRAWNSLASRGYVKSSPSEANWQIMQGAIDRLFGKSSTTSVL